MRQNNKNKIGGLLKKSMVDLNHLCDANKFIYSIIFQELATLPKAEAFETR